MAVPKNRTFLLVPGTNHMIQFTKIRDVVMYDRPTEVRPDQTEIRAWYNSEEAVWLGTFSSKASATLLVEWLMLYLNRDTDLDFGSWMGADIARVEIWEAQFNG